MTKKEFKHKFKDKKLNRQIKSVKECRKELTECNVGIVKNCLLMIQEIGIPENEKDLEDLQFAVKHYEETIKKLEKDVEFARTYIKTNAE